MYTVYAEQATLNIGDLVKYYDMYADGIVSGAGNGIILHVHQYSFEEEGTEHDDATPSALQDKYSSRNYSLNIYSVYRFKEQNIDLYEHFNLELISKADNNTRIGT